MKLRGKTAIVTGGGGGIGRATALALGLEGADIAVVDIAAESAAHVRDEVTDSGFSSAIARKRLAELYADSKEKLLETMSKNATSLALSSAAFLSPSRRR